MSKFALIRYKDKAEEVKSTKLIKKKVVQNKTHRLVTIDPLTNDDFSPNEWYRAKKQCTDDCEINHKHNNYVHCQIQCIRDSEHEIQEMLKLKNKRNRYPASMISELSGKTDEVSSCEGESFSEGEAKIRIQKSVGSKVMQKPKLQSFLKRRQSLNNTENVSTKTKPKVVSVQNVNLPIKTLHSNQHKQRAADTSARSKTRVLENITNKEVPKNVPDKLDQIGHNDDNAEKTNFTAAFAMLRDLTKADMQKPSTSKTPDGNMIQEDPVDINDIHLSDENRDESSAETMSNKSAGSGIGNRRRPKKNKYNFMEDEEQNDDEDQQQELEEEEEDPEDPEDPRELINNQEIGEEPYHRPKALYPDEDQEQDQDQFHNPTHGIQLRKRAAPKKKKFNSKPEHDRTFNVNPGNLKRFDIKKAEVYIGLDIVLDTPVWQRLQKNNEPSIYLRELSEIIWGREAIALRAFRPNACKPIRHVPLLNHPRVAFEKPELVLCYRLFKRWLLSKFADSVVIKSLNEFRETLSQKIQDVRDSIEIEYKNEQQLLATSG